MSLKHLPNGLLRHVRGFEREGVICATEVQLMSADAYNILGLVLGIAASWALAYPILWGYPKRNRLVYVDIQLESARRDLTRLEAMTDQLPASVYSAAEKDAIKAGYRQSAKPDIDALEAEKTRLGEGHESLSFFLSALGMLLLTFGFGAQLWAALTTKPQPPPPPPQAPGQVTMQRRSLPAFETASATEPTDVIRNAVCDFRRQFAAQGVHAAVVVGHYDWRALRSKVRAEFRENPGLAQRRADRVRNLLMDGSLCAAAPLGEVTAVVGGPRGADLVDDRVSEIVGIALTR